MFEAVAGASWADWLLLSAGLLLALYVLGTWRYDYFRRRGVASTRPNVPFAGDLLTAFLGFRSSVDAFRELYDRGEGHGVFGLFEFTNPTFMIRDPEILKVVAVKEFENFMNHRNIQSDKVDPIFARNLLGLKDQQWKDMRSTLSPAFTTSKIKGMFPFISQCGEQLVQHLRLKHTNSQGPSQQALEIDLKDLFARLATDVIATTAFGLSCDSLKEPHNEFYHMGKLLTTFSSAQAFKFLGFILVPKVMEILGARVLNAEATRFFDSLVHETIRERRKRGISRPDMLQLLMHAQDGALKMEAGDVQEGENVGTTRTKLDNDDISAQAVIFFFAGFETISNTLSFTSYLLSRHRDVQEKLQREVDQVMEESEGKPTYEHVQKMKYLDAVLCESLRVYPPAVITDRVCKKDTMLPVGASSGHIAVRKGHAISIPIIGLHYDSRYWDEPGKFNPERFSDENKHNIRPFTYIPFGVGPRICIGQRFALMEVKLTLLHLLAHFDLHPSTRTKYPMEFETGTNVMVRGGLWCCLTPRNT